MERLVVDGYNVIHAWEDLRGLLSVSLERARERLVERLAILAAIGDAKVTVVFDAHRTASSRNSQEAVDGVRVLYTRRGHTADHEIERQAYLAARAGEPLIVATSDGFHRDMLRGMGAAVIDVLELRRQVEVAEAELARRLGRYARG